jgi:hypothetical protein
MVDIMKATVLRINGIFIRYITEDGREDIDNSTYNEIMTVNKGDVIELSNERIQALKSINKS